MNKQTLIDLGLTTEQVEGVLKAYKDSLDGNFIPKEKFDAERQKVADLNEQLGERDARITKLSGFEGDNASLKATIDKMKTDWEAETEKFSTKYKEMETSTAIKMAISGSVYNADDILNKLDTSKIIIKDGAVLTGLNEQLEEIKKTNPYYFKNESNPIEGWTVSGAKPGDGGKGEGVVSDAVEWATRLASARSASQDTSDIANKTYWG